MRSIQIVMVKTRFPENIGMAARACANMGCRDLVLVEPEWWDKEKARPLATAKGEPVLENVRVVPALAEALADSVLTIGTTARTGGWRRDIATPEHMARESLPELTRGEKISLVFGPEDRGLTNQEIGLCQRLVTIPTVDASSLNVAQSVLLLLYEFSRTLAGARGAGGLTGSERDCLTGAKRDCFAGAERGCTGELRTSGLEVAGHPGSPVRGAAAVPEKPVCGPDRESPGPGVKVGEQERLLTTLKETLLGLDMLHGDNPEYFFMPWRRFFGRVGLRRHEFDMLMGFCRQVRNKIVLPGK